MSSCFATVLQLMLSKFENDGKLNPSFKTGPFQLPVAKIWGYPKEPQAPRFVLVSSAGVTRPNRYVTVSQTSQHHPQSFLLTTCQASFRGHIALSVDFAWFSSPAVLATLVLLAVMVLLHMLKVVNGQCNGLAHVGRSHAG